MAKKIVREPFEGAYRRRTVLVTGHTGFKGGWLALWLKSLGAHVVGLSLPPEKGRSFFQDVRLARGMTSILGDIRDAALIERVISRKKPEIIFHLAAQSLVLRSYQDPAGTYSTNVTGLVNVLEAARNAPRLRAVVVVTSDKCYANDDKPRRFKESDPMGGRDPYSASKGAAELVISSYRDSFFSRPHSPGLASARAGNVLGGGDWAESRILPDLVRSLQRHAPLRIRNPDAKRPWQHVLEPLSGYLWLAAKLQMNPRAFGSPWNFGPYRSRPMRVAQLVGLARSRWGEARRPVIARSARNPHEARVLALDCSKAWAGLGWKSILTTSEAVELAMDWYRNRECAQNFDAASFSLSQIVSYTDAARSAGVAWATGL